MGKRSNDPMVGAGVRASRMKSLTIGEVAAAARVGVETIRFYEREGLIAKPARPEAGYRQYPPDTVRRLLFIRRAKELGFGLKEIAGLLDLRVDPVTTCADVRAFTDAKIVDIAARRDDLARIQAVLETLSRTCPDLEGESPFLDAFAAREEEDGDG